MDSITFHIATKKDIQNLVDYRIRFAIELSGEQPPEKIDELKDQLKNYFLKSIENYTSISCIAKAGDEIAGIGSVAIREQPGNFKNLSGKWGYIMNMYTVPEFRRRGICRGILNSLIDHVSKMAITAFELHSTKAGEFVYLQNGFTKHPEPTYRKYIVQ
jgi:hypothetical protein